MPVAWVAVMTVARSSLKHLRLRLWRGLVLLFLVVSLSACQADFLVQVEVEQDGSGVVRTEIILDKEASDALLDLGVDSNGLPLRDLAESGWTIGRWVEDASGQTRIDAEKAFGNTVQFAEIMQELSGDDGVFQDFALTRDQSFGQVDYAVTGVLDPQVGIEAFSDAALEDALGASVESIVTVSPYNVDPQNISVSVVVELPGELQEEAPSGPVEDQSAPRGSWSTNLGDPTTVDVALRTTRRSISAQVLRGLSLIHI